jgi:hypothetical protein
MTRLMEGAARFCTVQAIVLMLVSALVSPLVGTARATDDNYDCCDYCVSQGSCSNCSDTSSTCLNCVAQCQAQACPGDATCNYTLSMFGLICYYNINQKRCSQNGDTVGIQNFKIYNLCRGNPGSPNPQCVNCACTFNYLPPPQTSYCACQ